MAATFQRRPLISSFRMMDDTLQELGLPGLFDVIPTPEELIHLVGLPTLNDLGESLKERVHAELADKKLFGR